MRPSRMSRRAPSQPLCIMDLTDWLWMQHKSSTMKSYPNRKKLSEVNEKLKIIMKSLRRNSHHSSWSLNSSSSSSSPIFSFPRFSSFRRMLGSKPLAVPKLSISLSDLCAEPMGALSSSNGRGRFFDPGYFLSI